MKIRKSVPQTDTVRNQRVFRIDDEIEVVLQDVDDLALAQSPQKESIEAVWNRNTDWLGQIKPLVLAGLNDSVPAVNLRKRKACNGGLTPLQIKQELGLLEKSNSLPKSVCVTRPIRSVLRQRNGASHLVKARLDMSDLETKVKMTPPNQVLVLDSDAEEFAAETLNGDPPPTTPTLECDTFSTTVVEKDDRELSPSSVVELVVKKEAIPMINLEDDENAQVTASCNGNQSEPDAESLTSETEKEVKKKYHPKPQLKKRFGELERLFVSLKEIPWAQSWSPNTFLSRNSKVTFPKRVHLKTNTKDVTIIPKKLIPMTTKSQNLQKEKVKGLVIADNVRKTKISSVSPTGNKEPAKKKRKLDAAQNGTAELLKKNRSPVLKTASMAKSGPAQKLSTDLAIKKYDASKMSKLKGGVKKKLGVTSCSVVPQQSASTLHLPSKMPAMKLPYSSACMQSTIPVMFRKEVVKTNSVVDTSKPQVKISPKILPFTTVTKCNGLSTVKTEGGASVTSESRLGSEQLLQKQLVSVMGKETTEAKKRKAEDESLRYSVRQSECAFRYKEIAVKKHLNYIQIILVPNRTRHNGLTLEALHELREALISAKKDQSCKVLLLNSCGSIFCSGIDLSSLVGQPHMTEKISNAVRSLIETLALFSKPVVAAVNGAAVGLGVTLLTYCDVVFASEKATFFTPYARLGHIPEGAMTLVLPQVVGSLVASDMLLRDRKLTAFQASIYGLVSEVIWPSQFMESVIPRVEAMASQSAQAMESTKILLRYHQWDKLQSTLEHESRLLPIQWQSEQCQEALRTVVAQPGGLIDW